MVDPDRVGVLGLFPSFDETGGIQVSGQLAWEGIRHALDPRVCQPYLFSYGGGGREARRNGGSAVYARSKLGAALAALGTRWPVRLVIVWHIGLLKLLPFFRARDARAAVVLHGVEAWKPLDRLTRALVRRVAVFLSNSEHTWQRFVRANPGCAHVPHRVVHLGLSTPLLGDAPRPGDPPAVLMLSRLARSEDYKGHREMIDVWPQVLARLPDARLWIAGDGDLRHDLESEAAKRRLGDRVKFWGWVSEERKQALITHSRCVALPSRQEGFGLVYVEAMRLGRPCLVSDVDAGREVVNPPEAGLAVDVGNPDSSATAIERLLTDGREWAAWSRQAQRRYAEHFTVTHFHARLTAALGPLL